MQRLIIGAVVALTMASALLAPEIAQARGRGRPSPYVMTPNGPMLKSVYYGQNLQYADPAMIARMQQQEQQLLNRGKQGGTAAKGGAKNTAGKPSAAKKK